MIMHYFYVIRYDTHGLPLWGQIAVIGNVPDPFAIAYNATVPRWSVQSC